MSFHAEKIAPYKSEDPTNPLVQKKNNTQAAFQFHDKRPEMQVQQKRQQAITNSLHLRQRDPFQLSQTNYSVPPQVQPVQKKENRTGLPDHLKSGIENLSGYSMDDVKVHYNSDKPAQLNAHAYAQGTDIHLASGQEKHLPHEAWHVVQQKEGRVKPTLQMKGRVNVNDDAGLEKEADVMGDRALATGRQSGLTHQLAENTTAPALSTSHHEVVQRVGALALLGGAAAFAYFGYKVREWWMNWRNLPDGAFARNDKSLTLVTQNEITTLLDGAAQDGLLPEDLHRGLLATATELINRGLLLWTGTGLPHAEVIVKDHRAGKYRVNIVVVIPKTTKPELRELEMTDSFERGQAIHELIHAFEAVSKIGGPQNLGEEVDEVKENDQVLVGNQLQWSRISESQSTVYLKELKELFEKDVRNVEGVEWGYYLERLNYGLSNRHEFPTVISQIVHDIHGLGAQEKLQNTQFYKRLIEIRDLVVASAVNG